MQIRHLWGKIENIPIYIYIYIYIYISTIQSASEDSGCGLFVYRIYDEYRINIWECSMYGYCYISFSFQVYIIKRTHRAYVVQLEGKSTWLNLHYEFFRRRILLYSPSRQITLYVRLEVAKQQFATSCLTCKVIWWDWEYNNILQRNKFMMTI